MLLSDKALKFLKNFPPINLFQNNSMDEKSDDLGKNLQCNAQCTLCQMHRKHFSNLWMLLVVGRMAWKSTNFAIFADLLYRSTRCIFKYGYLKFFAQLCTGQIQLLPLHMMPRDAPKLNPLRDMVFLCSKSV